MDVQELCEKQDAYVLTQQAFNEPAWLHQSPDQAIRKFIPDHLGSVAFLTPKAQGIMVQTSHSREFP